MGAARRRHAREPVDARAAMQPHDQRFGLIVQRMAQQDRIQPAPPRPVRQQPQPRLARRRHQIAAALAPPGQDFMGNAKRLRRLPGLLRLGP